MSASLPADMRGPQVKTPLLLLLLLATLTGTVLCQDEEQEPEDSSVSPDVQTEASSPTPSPEASNTLATGDENTSDYGSGLHQSSTENPLMSDPEFNHGADTTEDPVTTTETEENDLYLLIILIPAVLVVVIIGMIVCGIFICRRRSKNTKNEELRQEDPYLDGSSTDKVPMPMFEEDVPSVLELEMEELDQWMKKDSDTAEEATHSQSKYGLDATYGISERTVVKLKPNSVVQHSLTKDTVPVCKDTITSGPVPTRMF